MSLNIVENWDTVHLNAARIKGNSYIFENYDLF